MTPIDENVPENSDSSDKSVESSENTAETSSSPSVHPSNSDFSSNEIEKDSGVDKSQLQSKTIQADHQETNSEKIKAWSGSISSVASSLKSLAPWLWATVLIVVIIPLIGQVFIANSFQSSDTK